MVQALLVAGLLLMLYNMVAVFQLRGAAPGGIIGDRLGQLAGFIGLFVLGYVATAALIWSRPFDTLLLILGLLLAFGALFVWLVLRLVQAIVASLG